MHLIKCDICGATREWAIGSSSDWNMIEGKDTCPKCNELYRTLKDNLSKAEEQIMEAFWKGELCR